MDDDGVEVLCELFREAHDRLSLGLAWVAVLMRHHNLMRPRRQRVSWYNGAADVMLSGSERSHWEPLSRCHDDDARECCCF